MPPVPLRRLVTNVATWNPLASASEHGTFNYIDLGAVDQELKAITGARTLRCAEAPSRARQLVRAGDVLVSTVRPNLNGVAIVPSDLDGATASSGFCVIRANRELLEPGYVFNWVKSRAFVARMANLATGASYPAVSDRVVLDSEIPLPPVPEQRRIVAILDTADTLRTRRREAIAQLDRLAQAIFVDMFGDPATNPKGWPMRRFESVGENQDSQRIPVKSSDREGKRGDYPYYGASGIIDWVDDFIFDGDRLLIGEDGANLLTRSTPIAFVAQGKFWVNNHAHVIAFNGAANLRYLEFFVEHIDLTPYISGSAQPKLNRSNLDRLPVMLPPLGLQEEFAVRLAAVHRARADAISSQTLTNNLFSALQHFAFGGAF